MEELSEEGGAGHLEAILGPSWGHVGPILGPLGAILGPFWPILGPLGAILGPLGPSRGHLGRSPQILGNYENERFARVFWGSEPFCVAKPICFDSCVS